MKNALPKKLYHGTSTEELAGFASGETDDLLYLTSNYGNADDYAREKANEVGGDPIILSFDLSVLAASGKLDADHKWLPREFWFKTVSWKDGLLQTGHVTFEGNFLPALIETEYLA